MDNSLRKKAYSFIMKNPDISAKDLSVILGIDERQAAKLVKNLPKEYSAKNINEKNVTVYEKNNKKFTGIIGKTFKGKIEITKEGYGFFVPENNLFEDIFVHSGKLKDAVHGDTVLVKIKIFKGKKEGEVVQVVERAFDTVVGVIERHRNILRVYPFSRNFNGSIIIKSTNSFNDDDVVICKIERYPTFKSSAYGRVIEKIGTMYDKDIDNKIVMYKYGLSKEFNNRVKEECDLIESGNFKINKKNLTDFRDLYTVTIDGESARDFDDAISIEKADNTYILYVHIADVSRYVQRGTALNDEALRRGTSVYFPEFAIPMLPEVLSNGVCSLVPCEDRYTVTAKMEFDKSGVKRNVSFYRSVINSNRRLTYTYVNKIYNKETQDDGILDNFLKDAFELAEILIKKRSSEGVIDFDLPEPVFTFNDNGEVVDIKPLERGFAERLIECFMISANESVAEYFYKNKLKGIYRVHGEPDTRKLDDWIEVARNFGLSVPKIEYPVKVEDVAELSRLASKSKHSDLLNALLVRSMMRAEYKTENSGHFGLASSAYTHFTSPIRRYPDLLVHRALLSSLDLGSLSETLEELDNAAALCSKQERLAQDAEHDIGAFKKLEFISSNFDDVYEGYINRISQNGLFIYIEKLMMTGYVDFSYIDYDYFYKSEDIAVGERSKERYRAGDKVRITPYRLNPVTLQADFNLFRKKGRMKK